MRSLVIGLICAAAIGAVACQVQGSCETTPSFVEYCAGGPTDTTCQGHVIDATHWESGPQNSAFLNFGAEQVYHLNFRDAQTGQVISGKLGGLLCQVSAVPQGNAAGNNWIPGGEQLCEVSQFDEAAGTMFVRNDTCGSYFFRVVVTLIPNTSADAGTE
jgi:hypothetical protein